MVGRDVPNSISSDRLLIVPPRLEDVRPVFDAVHESLAELRPWMPWSVGEYTMEGCEESIRRAIARFVTYEDLRYHFFDRTSGELIGSSGLHRLDWRIPRCEIGYWVRTSRAGKGYVSEAVLALTRVAFERLGAKRVEIRCDDRNDASGRVAERCGFRLDGLLRNWTLGTDGSLRDERIYSLTDLSGLQVTGDLGNGER
ncbi:MAG: GNAT family N-acetyltransferase [Trueperaceae bacterium]